MIIKILGILDIFIGIVFWLFGILHILPSKFILLLGIILLVKGLIFVTSLNLVSALDIVSSGIIITATSIELPVIVIVLTTLFLLQKGIFSMLS